MIDENCMKKHPPQLRQVSQCASYLDFEPRSPWPQGLPAVAINGYVIAGFQQDSVFDHCMSWDQEEEIASLFRSLYFELSACELARLWKNALLLPSFPVKKIFSKFHVPWTESIEKLCPLVTQLPIGFQNFCTAKKWSFSDFLPLTAAQGLIMSPFYLRMIEMNLSRNHGVLALELIVDLLFMGRTPVELLPSDTTVTAEQWLESLRALRYPESSGKDHWSSRQLDQLPWPGTAEARWTRQGDKPGIELKLFVSNPSDLKKYLQSLSEVQSLLEKDSPWNKH